MHAAAAAWPPPRFHLLPAGAPLDLIKPETMRWKVFEPVLLLGKQRQRLQQQVLPAHGKHKLNQGGACSRKSRAAGWIKTMCAHAPCTSHQSSMRSTQARPHYPSIPPPASPFPLTVKGHVQQQPQQQAGVGARLTV
jgi:hypothetical protein